MACTDRKLLSMMNWLGMLANALLTLLNAYSLARLKTCGREKMSESKQCLAICHSGNKAACEYHLST